MVVGNNHPIGRNNDARACPFGHVLAHTGVVDSGFGGDFHHRIGGVLSNLDDGQVPVGFRFIGCDGVVQVQAKEESANSGTKNTKNDCSGVDALFFHKNPSFKNSITLKYDKTLIKKKTMCELFLSLVSQ